MPQLSENNKEISKAIRRDVRLHKAEEITRLMELGRGKQGNESA